MERAQRLVFYTALNCREYHAFRFSDLTGDNNLLRVKQVNGHGNGFTQMVAYLHQNLTRQFITGNGCTADV